MQLHCDGMMLVSCMRHHMDLIVRFTTSRLQLDALTKEDVMLSARRVRLMIETIVRSSLLQ